jgi:hypothetical protein
MLTSTWGSIFFSGSELLLHYSQKQVLATILLNIGWVAMITGFSFVLYSRLYILQPNAMVLRVILSCIIVDAFLFHGPVFVTTIILNIHKNTTAAHVFEITSFMEVAFSVQETILTALYIYLFLQYTAGSRDEPKTYSTLRLLVAAECVVFSTDIVLSTLLYKKVYLPRVMIHAFTSVLKLKIEFIVLNSLVEYAQAKSQRTLSDISSGQTVTPGSPTTPTGMHMIRKFSEMATTEDLRAGPSQEMVPTRSPERGSLLSSAVSPDLMEV